MTLTHGSSSRDSLTEAAGLDLTGSLVGRSTAPLSQAQFREVKTLARKVMMLIRCTTSHSTPPMKPRRGGG